MRSGLDTPAWTWDQTPEDEVEEQEGEMRASPWRVNMVPWEFMELTHGQNKS